MLLGQLYYFDKVLNQFPSPLSIEDLIRLELLGCPKHIASEFRSLDTNDIVAQIKADFAASFEKILMENRLDFAKRFWSNLTNPLAVSQTFGHPNSEFKRKLIDWSDRGFDLLEVEELLKQGQLTSNEEDFALYYGLRVLFILTKSNPELNQSKENPQAKDATDDQLNPNFEPDQEPQILILTDTTIAPLFVNVNCEFLALEQDPKLMTEYVQKVLISKPKIKLVIVEGENVDDLTRYLQKHLPSNLLVTSLSLQVNNQKEQNYFDQLVKDTLGIRLT